MQNFQPDRYPRAQSKTSKFGALFKANPILFSGSVVSVFAMSAIFVNAIWFQPVRHPAPLFSTRNLQAPAQLQPTKQVVETRQIQTVSASREASPEVLKEVQAALANRGYYTGKVDGKYGSRTKKAILDFQQDNALEADGKASVRLLSQVLLSASATPSQVPVPRANSIAELVEQKSNEKLKPVRVSETPAPDKGLVARIQAGLKNYGYEELVVDGQPGRQTKTAIQRFQLDYGMKITGEPTTQVLDKLREIGAYTQG